MTILLMGDEHTYGYGLSARQLSYVGHFVRRLSHADQSVTVDAYAHATLSESVQLLARLPLNQYDLIVLQLGPDLLRHLLRSRSESRAAVPVLPILKPAEPHADRPKKRQFAAAAAQLLDVAASVVPAAGYPGELARLLTLLRPYRHTTLLVTPFPCRTWPGQWLRERSRSVLLNEGTSQAFSVFDSGTVVQPRDEYFLTDDDEHLNAVGHELIGRALFDFYQSAPTIVTVQAINRN